MSVCFPIVLVVVLAVSMSWLLLATGDPGQDRPLHNKFSQYNRVSLVLGHTTPGQHPLPVDIGILVSTIIFSI